MNHVVGFLQTINSVKKQTVKQKTEAIRKNTGIGNISGQETACNSQGTEKQAGNPIGQEIQEKIEIGNSAVNIHGSKKREGRYGQSPQGTNFRKKLPEDNAFTVHVRAEEEFKHILLFFHTQTGHCNCRRKKEQKKKKANCHKIVYLQKGGITNLSCLQSIQRNVIQITDKQNQKNKVGKGNQKGQKKSTVEQ